MKHLIVAAAFGFVLAFRGFADIAGEYEWVASWEDGEFFTDSSVSAKLRIVDLGYGYRIYMVFPDFYGYNDEINIQKVFNDSVDVLYSDDDRYLFYFADYELVGLERYALQDHVIIKLYDDSEVFFLPEFWADANTDYAFILKKKH